MRLTITVLMCLANLYAWAQQVNGVVVDRSSGSPISFATINTGSVLKYTDQKGRFNLELFVHDTLLISCVGYQSKQVVITTTLPNDTLKIVLTPVSVLLKDVNVRGKRDYKQDSIRNRRMFSAVYNYKGTAISDAITHKASLAYIPGNNITAPNSTTSLVGVNVLSVLGLFNRNKTTTAKLQKAMIADEESAYVERAFSKQKVAAITRLKGDSLQTFLIRYRPSSSAIKKMTDYEVITYIKDSYVDFLK